MKIKMAKTNTLPSTDLILNLLNDNANVVEKILCFYENYINASASDLKDGKWCLDEDLVQEIKKEIIISLPSLRKLLKKKIKSDSDIMLIIL